MPPVPFSSLCHSQSTWHTLFPFPPFITATRETMTTSVWFSLGTRSCTMAIEVLYTLALPHQSALLCLLSCAFTVNTEGQGWLSSFSVLQLAQQDLSITFNSFCTWRNAFLQCGQALAQVVPGGCGVPGDTLNPTGHIIGKQLSVALPKQGGWPRWSPKVPYDYSHSVTYIYSF